MMFLDNLSADGEPQSGALIPLFGGEARIEDLFQMIRLDAPAGIRDLHIDILSIFIGPDLEHAPLLDRVGGIDEQVHKDLIELIGKAVDLGKLTVFLDHLQLVLDLMMDQYQGAIEAISSTGSNVVVGVQEF